MQYKKTMLKILIFFTLLISTFFLGNCSNDKPEVIIKEQSKKADTTNSNNNGKKLFILFIIAGISYYFYKSNKDRKILNALKKEKEASTAQEVNLIFFKVKESYYKKALAYMVYSSFDNYDDRYKFLDDIKNKYGNQTTHPYLDLSIFKEKKISIENKVRTKMKEEIGDLEISNIKIITAYEDFLLEKAKLEAINIFNTIIKTK